MFNPLNLISKFIKSSNQKELDKAIKIVEKINSLEEKIVNLDDTDFPKKTLELKDLIKSGKSLNEIKEVLNTMSLYLGMEIPNWPPDNIAELSKKLEENNY